MVVLKRVLAILVCGAFFSFQAPPVVLNLPQAYQEILEANLELKAATAGVDAKTGERIQAGLRPNPLLTAGLDDFGRFNNSCNNEFFVGITQLLELGGKRSARIRVANADQCAAEWNLEVLKSDLFAKLHHAFISMAAAQEGVELAMELQKIADQTLDCIAAKTASGKGSRIEAARAEVAAQSTKLFLIRQQANLEKAKRRLLSLWNGNAPFFDAICFPLYELSQPPPLELLSEALSANPEIARAEAVSTRACEILALERSRRIPNVAVQVGVSTEKFTRDPTLSIGIDIPIPLFDRNQGNICRAAHEQVQAIYNQLDTSNQLCAELAVLYEDWYSSYIQATALKDSILPAAEESFQLAQTCYDEGKFDLLYLLDARGTLFDIRQKYLEAVEEYHHKRAEILRLTTMCPSFGIDGP